MKNFKISIAWLAVFALVFTSCSKDEAGVVSDDPETVQLTFGAMLNAFNEQNKQASYECNDDAVPAYVRIGGSQSATAVPSEDDLFRVDLKNNNGSWETVYSEDLALPAGTYYLHHFIVYDADDNVLWVAPREGSTFEAEVDDALPMQIDLVAGTKPYIDVEVLCYVARTEEAYGYPFFDFDVVEVENSYCLFVNYCDVGDEGDTGREYPANFRLDIWADGYDGEQLIISGENEVDLSGEWPAADVLCLALPEIVGDDLYARVTVLDDGQAYTPDATDYYEFRISQDDLNAQANIPAGQPGYEHVRINCDEENEGPITVVPCELQELNDSTCTVAWLENSNEFMAVTGNVPFDLTVDGDRIGDVTVTVENGVVTLRSNLPVTNGYVYSAYEVWISSSTTEDDLLAAECAEITPGGTLELDLGDLQVDYNELYIRMRAYVCDI